MTRLALAPLFLLVLWLGLTPQPSFADSSLARMDAVDMFSVLRSADIPEALWLEFMNIAYCESRFDPGATSDGGESKGLFQIRWDLWSGWARRNGHGLFPESSWKHPVANARLAYLIGEHYDMPRYNYRWHQWSTKPHWRECRAWMNTRDIFDCPLKLALYYGAFHDEPPKPIPAGYKIEGLGQSLWTACGRSQSSGAMSHFQLLRARRLDRRPM